MAPPASRRKGPPTAPPEPAVCPECHGGGYVVTEQGTLTPCGCGSLDRFHTEERLARAGIPERYVNKTLDTFQSRSTDRRRQEQLQKIVHAAKAYASGFHLREENMPGLLFRGGTGVGKTHIAIGILREVVRNGYTGLYCNVTELLARLRSTYEKDSAVGESEVIEEYLECDLLVLDDLGNESTSPWVLDRLYLLINSRYESSRPVIVTTNCDETALKEKVGPRIASRLYEMCLGQFPDFPREDFRIKMLHQ